MTTTRQLELDGSRGKLAVHRWDNDDRALRGGHRPRLRRARRALRPRRRRRSSTPAPRSTPATTSATAQSEGERVSIEDMEDLVADVHRVVEAARGEHPGLPVVLLGHSLGGIDRHALRAACTATG